MGEHSRLALALTLAATNLANWRLSVLISCIFLARLNAGVGNKFTRGVYWRFDWRVALACLGRSTI